MLNTPQNTKFLCNTCGIKSSALPSNLLTVICDGGAPAADGAGVSRFRAAGGQRNGLNVLVEAGRLSQTHHGEAV